MEITDPAQIEKHHHAWLEWLGLEEPPPNAESWVPVAQGFVTGASASESEELSSRLSAELKAAGIDSQLRSYAVYDTLRGGGMYSAGGMDPCVAVMVHNRDLHRAVEIAHAIQDALEAQDTGTSSPSGPSEDDELTRLAMEAGPPPPE